MTESVGNPTAGISPAASAWAIEPTVVPRLRMAGCHALKCLAQQGIGGIALVALKRPVPHRGSHPDVLIRDLDLVQSGNPIDIDEMRGVGQPHAEDRDQALATGEHFAVMPKHRQAWPPSARPRSASGRQMVRVSPSRSCLSLVEMERVCPARVDPGGAPLTMRYAVGRLPGAVGVARVPLLVEVVDLVGVAIHVVADRDGGAVSVVTELLGAIARAKW